MPSIVCRRKRVVAESQRTVSAVFDTAHDNHAERPSLPLTVREPRQSLATVLDYVRSFGGPSRQAR